MFIRLMRRARKLSTLVASVLAPLLVSGTVGAQGANGSSPALQGEVMSFVFDRSQIFPGTVRDYWIYVPQQYDPAKLACLYVNQDGIQYKAPAVFDELIHKKEMPVAIGMAADVSPSDAGQLRRASARGVHGRQERRQHTPASPHAAQRSDRRRGGSGAGSVVAGMIGRIGR